jgi:RimJ/RimL family protein N-acetyltransferase
LFTHNEIKLRKVTIDDLNDLFNLKSESWFGTHHVSFLTMQDQERWYQSLDNHPTSPRQLILIGQNPSNFGVFKLNLDWANQSAECGWDVYKDFRGFGLGKKLAEAGIKFCFEVLNLRRISCEILEINNPSIKCAKHVKFIEEGRKREAILKKGVPVDSLVFGILAKDYFKKEKNEF